MKSKISLITFKVSSNSYPIGEISELYDNGLDNKIEDNWERIHNEVDQIFIKNGIKL